MGEARKRGTYDERRAAAICRGKAMLTEMAGGRDPVLDTRLRAGIAPFFARFAPDEWGQRRAAIIAALKGQSEGSGLQKAGSIRIKDDEIAWYLFLAEQALNDPFNTDISQSQRTLVYFAGIGSRWEYAHRVCGLEAKLDEIIHTYKSSPDGGIFELCVALGYASKGWDVEFIPTQRGAGVKTPDMVARKDGAEIYIECKRQDRRAAYSENERNEFLRLWDTARSIIQLNGQWLWMRGTFHVELSTLPSKFLSNILEERLPLRAKQALLYDGPEVTLHVRKIDIANVQDYFKNNRVKANSPTLTNVIGGDWAPKNASVTMAKIAAVSKIVDCEAAVLGTYIEHVEWACGFTREIDAPVSIEKKARDIKNLLAAAVKQVPSNAFSVIHIAAETLEGRDVERRRTEKVKESIPAFVTDKPVLAVRFHRFQPNSSTDLLFEFDETVETFALDGAPLDDLPVGVVIPDDVEMRDGSHWELYPHG